MGRWLMVAVELLSCCGVCAAQDVTQADIDAWLSIWQRREGLQDWKINARIVGAGELERQTIGDVRWWEPTRTAEMRVLSAADLQRLYGYSAASVRTQTEETVVHELMHVVMRGLGNPASCPHAVMLRADAVNEAFAEMLFHRVVPGGVSEAQYIDRELALWPFAAAPDAKKAFMLELVRAMAAVSADDVAALGPGQEYRPWFGDNRPGQQAPARPCNMWNASGRCL